MDIKNNTDKVVYVIQAEDAGGGYPVGYSPLETYSVADSYELAEKIAKTDEADGQIYPGWSIMKMKLNTSVAGI